MQTLLRTQKKKTQGGKNRHLEEPRKKPAVARRALAVIPPNKNRFMVAAFEAIAGERNLPEREIGGMARTATSGNMCRNHCPVLFLLTYRRSLLTKFFKFLYVFSGAYPDPIII